MASYAIFRADRSGIVLVDHSMLVCPFKVKIKHLHTKDVLMLKAVLGCDLDASDKRKKCWIIYSNNRHTTVESTTLLVFVVTS